MAGGKIRSYHITDTGCEIQFVGVTVRNKQQVITCQDQLIIG